MPGTGLKTKIIPAKKGKLSLDQLAVCAHAIEKGGLIVFPTDTVYGLGCNAFHLGAIKKIYALKGRSYTKALPILLGDASQLPLIAAEILPQVLSLTDEYWPGALTLVFKTAPLALVATRGRSTVAVRVPDHVLAQQILTSVHVPLATTSVNTSGEPSVTKGSDAVKLFSGRVDVIVDGGACDWRKESSVVDATHFPFTILRQGVISKTDLAKQLKLA